MFSLKNRTLILLIGIMVLIGFAGCSGGGGGGGGGEGVGPTATSPGVGSVEFTPGSLPASTNVAISSVVDTDSFQAFDLDAVAYEPTARSAYVVRITTGQAVPDLSTSATVMLDVPASLTIPTGQGVDVFARFQTSSEEGEEYDHFEVVPSTWDPSMPGSVKALVPATAFTSNRTGDGTVEVLLLLAVTPGVSSAVSKLSKSENRLLSALGVFPPPPPPQGNPGVGCKVDPVAKGDLRPRFRAPVVLPLTETSPFNPWRVVVVKGKTYIGHFGVDIRAPIGTKAVAVASGTVLDSYLSPSFGNTVILKTAIGNVLYAHLSSRSVGKGDTVQKNQQIGLTGSTGSMSAGPHLHLELNLSPVVTNNKAKRDGWPCILPPDYKGNIDISVDTLLPGTSHITTQTSSGVQFSYSDKDDRYEPQGAFTVDYLQLDLINNCQVHANGGRDFTADDGTMGLFYQDKPPNAPAKYLPGGAQAQMNLNGTTTCTPPGPVSIPWYATWWAGFPRFDVGTDGTLSATGDIGAGGNTEHYTWSLSVADPVVGP